MDAQMAINEVSRRGFTILKEISISPKKYIYDLCRARDSIGVAVETDNQGDFVLAPSGDIGFISYNESYLHRYFDSYLFILNNAIKTPSCNYHHTSTTQQWKYFQIPTGYKPHGLANCRSGRLLLCLWNQKPREKSQGKVCKMFVNDTMQQICEYEYDKSTPLFKCPTYITENGNGDICVSDEGAVVVLNEVGMLRFRYKGLAADRNFDPYGICADSARNIIIADMKNDKIHMIDENGGYLCYVQYENMEMPRALCVGANNTLYVGEWKSGVVKVISPM